MFVFDVIDSLGIADMVSDVCVLFCTRDVYLFSYLIDLSFCPT